jgi:hypothetical protein
MGPGLSPDRGCTVHTVLKLPRWASTDTSGLSPFTTWDRTGPSQSRT